MLSGTHVSLILPSIITSLPGAAAHFQSHDAVTAYALRLRGKMADLEGETQLDRGDRPHNAAVDSPVAMDSLLATLRGLEVELRQQDISETSSSNYCNNFCQALMQYAGRRNSIEHGLPLLEVYCLSITCFVSARPHLTTESDKVALVLKRLALSCFELLLSVPEHAIPYEAWMQFHRSVQAAHDTLQQYGNTDLQALLRILGEGGAWSNPALIALLTGQPTNPEEVGALLQLEGDSFMEMRVKHLLKMGEVTQAMLLAKACADSAHMASRTSFRQIYVTHLCDMLPSEGAIMEISRVDGREVLEIICNLETEGQENLALILCTTFLTQQLQQGNIYCSWELTLFWSKLQRRVEASLESFLGQCLQLGAIARTVYHLLFLVRVIQSEAEQLGLAASVELCVRALQLPRHEDADTKTSVCKTVACLLPDDLEVRRACQLTEFLLCTSPAAYTALEELYLRPDQKHEESSPLVPNNLRCELLLALKAHWPFDPEFWDWKTLKRHCLRLLGPEAKGEEERPEGGGQEERPEGGGGERVVAGDAGHQSLEEVKGKEQRVTGDVVRNEEPAGSRKDVGESEVKKCTEVETTEAPGSQKAAPIKKAPSERSLRWQKYKFFCLICQREVIEARLLHHSRKHVEDGVFTCPVCLQKFPARQDFVVHTSEHIQMPARRSLPQKRKKVKKKVNLQQEMEEDEELDSSLEPGEIALDPSLLMYYQSTQDPDILEHLLEQAAAVPKRPADDDYITFEYIAAHFQLQEREVYPCPATGCAKNFKQFKYLSVHLKAEHDGSGDENVRHYLEMKDRREKCTFCRRHFMTAYHHRRHRRVHYGDRPYTCVVTGCGARFDTTNELLAHKQSHGFQLSYRCELKGCSLTFCDLGLLYHHEAQHFRDAAYSCTHSGCKKFYFSKRDFLKHLATHGITFTEEDFAAQREKKRNPTDCLAEGLTVQEALPGDESRNGTDVKCCSLTNATPTSSSTIREPRGTLTCVAVCFDGRKFTCGFESCRRTFTQASEVQKHLKCVHPGQIKSERKEKKGQKKLSKSKGDVVRESAQAHPGCLLAQGSGQGRSCSSAAVPHKPAPTLSPLTDDFLKDVLLGLSRLNLSSCSPRSSQSDPCHSISGSSVSQVSCPPTSSASASPSAAKASRKKNAPKPQPAVEKQPPPRAASSSPSERPSQTAQQQSDFLILPSTKPYRCEVKGCKFKSVTCHALKGHYLRRHGFSQERLRGIDVFKTSNFKPFKCHLCPKGYRQKTELRIHYMQMHKFTETLVEQMHCSSKRREEGKAPEPRKPKVSTRRGPQLQKKPAKKLPKLVRANNTCEQRGVKMDKEERKKCVRVWTPQPERENGLVKPYNMSNKTDVKAAKTPSSDLQDSQAEEEMERASREGRGSRRLVAKGNLCYILTKYHKPFHCVHKDCSSAFTHQSSLVRHLQAVHRYNRAQLCLEEDLELRHGAGVRKADTAASKLQRLQCKHKGCGKNFPNNSSLWRHYRRQHREDTEDGHEPSSPDAPPSSGIPARHPAKFRGAHTTVQV
ncbi:hypothetical protein GJAV_G00000260 [Gymnothorax javanicus]|nr:hypothetical protein GJAV_G00000260 [Gymnothorax javanicus]